MSEQQQNEQQVTMNFLVEEMVQHFDAHNNCPDNEQNMFLSLLLGNETREQMIREITKSVNVKIECMPFGFQENQFFSPAQTRYSCYVNDIVKVSVVFDQKYLESISQSISDDQIPNVYCSMLLDNCKVQLKSFVEGTNLENTILDLNIELSQLGKNTNENERYTKFNIPRPTQKRGKKKEKAVVASVTKKIGFVQLVHSDSGKVIARSDNMWIRSKSREEMETKKKRSSTTTAPKKNKKRKIKVEKPEKKIEQVEEMEQPLMAEEFIKEFFREEQQEEEEEQQGQPTKLEQSLKTQNFEQTFTDLSFLKPQLGDQTSTMTNYFSSNYMFPFLPTATGYFPNSCNTTFIPINPCCHIMPINPIFETPNDFYTYNSAIPPVNYQTNETDIVLPHDKSLDHLPADLFCDDLDMESKKISNGDDDEDSEFLSPLSDISAKQCEVISDMWGEVSPLSVTSNCDSWTNYFEL